MEYFIIAILDISLTLVLGTIHTHFLKHKKRSDFDPKELSRIKDRGQLIYGLNSILAMPLLLILGFIIYTIGKNVAVLWHSDMINSERYFVHTDNYSWSIPALLLCGGLTFVVLDGICRVMAGKDYELIMEFIARKEKTNIRRLKKAIIWLTVPPGLISVFLLLNTYIGVNDETLYINTIWSLQKKEYSLDEISSIYEYRFVMGDDGELINRKQYCIYRGNEEVFCTHTSIFVDNKYKLDNIVHFIQRRNNLRIEDGRTKVDF